MNSYATVMHNDQAMFWYLPPTTVRILTPPGIHYTLHEEFRLNPEAKGDIPYEQNSLTVLLYKHINAQTHINYKLLLTEYR
jgi:hypothetical protein